MERQFSLNIPLKTTGVTLRTKTLVVITITLIILIVLMHFASRLVVLQGFSRLEEKYAERDIQRVLAALDNERATMNAIATDWASWDDTYTFIQDPNQAFVTANLLGGAFERYRLNVMLFIDNEGQLIFGQGYDLVKRELVPISPAAEQHFLEDAALLKHSDTAPFNGGIDAVPEGPILVVAQPILTTLKEGPPQGVLILGRYLTPSEITHLAQSTYLSLDIRQFDDPQLPDDFQAARAELSGHGSVFVQTTDQETIASYTLLEEVNGKPGLILRSEAPRDIYDEGQTVSSYFLVVLILSSIIFICTTLVLLEKLILARLAWLNTKVHEIGQSGDLNMRLPVKGHDELGSLADTVNGMLTALQQSQTNLSENEFRLQHIVSSISDCIYAAELTLDGKVKQHWILSPRLAELTGYAIEKFAADSAFWSSLIHPADREIGMAHIAKLASGQDSEAEYRVINAAQNTLWIRDSGHVERSPNGHTLILYGVVSNITDRKQVEDELAAERNLLRTVIDLLPDLIYVKDLDGQIILSNIANAIGTGVSSPEEVVGRTDFDNYPYELAAQYRADELTVIKTGQPLINREELAFHPGTQQRYILTSKVPLCNAQGEITGIVGIGRNITERKQAEAALRQSEERFAKAFQAGPVPMAIVTLDEWRYVDVNDSFLQHVGYTRDEVIAHTALELALWISPDAQARITAILQEQGFLRQLEGQYRHKSGEKRDCIVSMEVIELTNREHALIAFEDVTARKQIEAEREQLLRLMEARLNELATVAEVSLQMTTILDLDQLLWTVSNLTKENFGLYHAHIYLLDEARRFLVLAAGSSEAGKRMAASGHKILVEQHRSLVANAARTRKGVIVNNVQQDSLFLPNPLLPDTCSEMAIPIIIGDMLIGVLDVQSNEYDRFTLEDVNVQTTLAAQLAIAINNARLFTKRKQVEEALRRANRAYRTLSDCNQAMVRATDEERLLQEICQIIVDKGGYRMVWAGLVEYDEAKSVRPVAWEGDNGEYVENLKVSWGENEHGMGPTGKAVRSGQLQLVTDIATEPNIDLWRERALARGFTSVVTLPLMDGRGQAFGALSVYSGEKQPFDQEEINLLDELASDLAFGILGLRGNAERERAQKAEREHRLLAEVLRDTAAVINSTLDFDEVLERILTNIERVVPHTLANIMLVENRVARVVRARGYPEPDYTEWILQMEFSVDEMANLRQMVETKRQIVVSDTTLYEAWIDYPQMTRIRSYAGAPIIIDGQVTGFLNLDSPNTGFFTETHAEHLQAFADQAAVALRNAQLYDEVQRHVAELETLRQVTLDITAQLDLTSLLNTIVRSAVDMLQVDAGGIYFYRPERDVLEWAVSVGDNIGPIGSTLRRNEGLSGKVWEQGEALLMNNYQQWEGRTQQFPSATQQMGVIAVPITWQEQRLGVFTALSFSPQRPFSERNIYQLNLFANQAAIAIQNATLFAAEREQRALAEALQDTAAVVNSTLDFNEVLERILENVGRVLPHETANIMLIEDGYVHVVGSRGYEKRNLDQWIKQLHYPVEKAAGMVLMIETGKPTIVPDTNEYPNWALSEQARWVQSYAGAPIIQNNQVIGFLNLYSDIPGFFTEDHTKRLQSFADQAAIAIQNAQLYAAEREQRALAEALRDTAAVINSTLNFDEVLDRILENVGRVVEHDAANVMLIENHIARFARGHGYEEHGVSDWVRSLRFIISEVPIWQKMLQTRQPFAIPDTAEDPDWLNLPEESWIRSTVKAPICREGQIIGILHLDSATPGFFNNEDGLRLQAFADQAAIAIQNAQLYDEVHHHAMDLEERVRARTAELEAQRAQLQAILDAMGEGVVYTIGNRAVYVNQAFVDLLKYEAKEMLFNATNVYHQMNAPVKNLKEIETAVQKAFQRDLSWRGELRLRCKDGVEFDAALTITQVAHTGTDADKGIVTIFRDISQEKALQAQKDRFIANASHELRTPLANVKTRLYLIRRQPEKLDQHLQVLERVTDSMTELIENLLDISRFERGIIVLSQRPVTLQDLIAEVISIQQPEAENKSITISYTLPEEPIVILADPQRLTQVITNLLTNAINYTPPEGQITVELSDEMSNGEPQAVLRVRDTGVGIPQEAKVHIFEPFFRANESSATGTGLGLTIAQEIVHRHDGTIEVESEVGEGSTFIVRLNQLRE